MNNSSPLERYASLRLESADGRAAMLPNQERAAKRPQQCDDLGTACPPRKIQKTQRSPLSTDVTAAPDFPATTLSSVAVTSAHNKKKRTSWEDHFSALVEYKGQHGHTNVPRMYAANRALGKWVGKQRSEPSKLTQSQRDRLTALGFDWETLQERQDRRWNEKFSTLKRRQAGGQSLHLISVEDPELAKWIQNQRQLFLTSRLPLSRQEKLESIGFVWRGRTADSDDGSAKSGCSESVAAGSVSVLSASTKPKKETPKQDEKWQQQYRKLVAFEQKYGHCKVPALYKEDRGLGEWVRTQRKAHQQHYLKPERQALLEELGFAWKVDMPDAHVHQKEWRERLGQLEVFVQRHEHVRVEEMPPALKKWIREQQEQWRQGYLSEWQAKRLQTLGLEIGGASQKERRALPEAEGQDSSESESDHSAESEAAYSLVSLNRSLSKKDHPSGKLPATQKILSVVARQRAVKHSLEGLSPLLLCALKKKTFSEVQKLSYDHVMKVIDEICDDNDRNLDFPELSDRETDSEDEFRIGFL